MIYFRLIMLLEKQAYGIFFLQENVPKHRRHGVFIFFKVVLGDDFQIWFQNINILNPNWNPKCSQHVPGQIDFLLERLVNTFLKKSFFLSGMESPYDIFGEQVGLLLEITNVKLSDLFKNFTLKILTWRRNKLAKLSQLREFSWFIALHSFQSQNWSA